MKKALSLILVLLISLCLFACGPKNGDETGTDKTPSSQSGATNAPAHTEGNGATAGPGATEAASATDAPAEGSEGLKIAEYDDSCIVTGIGTFTGAELVIPSHVNGKPVTSIDEDAITNETMVSLVIPGTVRSIGEEAVSDSKKLETVTFGEGLIGVGYGSFAGCVSLKNVMLPSTLESVSGSAFRSCTALTEVTFLGNSSLGNNAFFECASLKKVTFAGTDGRAYSVKSSAFESDGALETVIFSEGLETIGSFSFVGCKGLKEIYLPASLKKIEVNAFQKTGEYTVYYAGSEEDWNKVTVANGNEDLGLATFVYNYKG